MVCQVLSGLGGVGKSQLAAHYARTRWNANDVDLLVWITAASREQILEGYAETAIAIGLVDDRDRDAERAAARLLTWLAGTDKRWLVVLDDLTVPGDLRGLWPPSAGAGATVVTTRRRDDALGGSGRTLVDVGLFTPSEARAYLTAKLANRPGAGDEDAEIDGLAADLGLLPLALAQAATYMIDRGLTCAEYRARFADRRRTLDQLVPEGGALPDDHTSTVAATWSLSIDVADALDPAGSARPLLELASLLDPNNIPLALFTTDAVLAWLAARRVPADKADVADAGGEVTPDDVNDGLRNLHRLNLATVAADTVRVHALVQRATREATRRESTPDDWRRLVHATADAVVAVGNQPWPQRDLTEMVWHNARTLIGHGGGELWDPDGHTVLFGLGESLGGSGHVRKAAAHFRDLARTAAEHLGPSHRDTFLARSRHARWLAESGHPAQAVAELEQVIADRTRALGENDIDNLNDMANLATYRGETGNVEVALRTFAGLAERRAEIHGPNHPKTLITRANLARWCGESGDIPRAVRMYTELVPLFTEVYGATHPETLTAYSQLAAWRGELNPAVGAAQLARLLPVKTRVFGAYSADTLSTRRNLAMLHSNAGQPAQAIGELTALIADYEQHVDPDHPAALALRRDLAGMLTDQGDAIGAYRVLKDLLADQVRLLGVNHPGTNSTREAVNGIEEALHGRLVHRLRTARGGRRHQTTLTRLAGDLGTDVDWVRHALGVLVDAGTVQVTRGGPVDPGPVDLSAIADHARFEIVVHN
ncbi:tetratricopeptide repeat protein [Micromonospora thermarum]|uniref:Tetratricopeptide repeat protein n=1 Tax=Micromonospora thermarum TaxID=2720024 RepID=A0ABX0Z231_9ACTN|nr:tetratricopeptide repeat protein [Micromonospora thermarum]NJP31832.1 tetratricopeptide repeat protein [Micromonospora thermarum]